MTTLTGVVSFPAPAYSNLPIEPQFYQPSVFVISAIALGTTTTITTTTNLNYVIGQQIRLLIPPPFGSIQLNNQTGYVLSIPQVMGVPQLNQVTVSINSSVNVNPFIASSSTVQSAQIAAIGDINQGYTSTTGANIPLVTIPGSFINIS